MNKMGKVYAHKNGNNLNIFVDENIDWFVNSPILINVKIQILSRGILTDNPERQINLRDPHQPDLPPSRRPRGRPRKTDSAVIPKATEPTPRRPRGRPKKTQ